MGELGDVLEALHRPPSCRTAHLATTLTFDTGRWQGMVQAWSARQAPSTQEMVASAAFTTGAQDDPHAPLTYTSELWWTTGDRFGVDQSGQPFVRCDGHEAWQHVDGFWRSIDPQDDAAPAVAAVVDRVSYVGDRRALGVTPDEVLGRPCWRVDLSAPTSRHTPLPFLERGIVGVEVTLWVDRQSGLVVGQEGRFEGDVVSRSTPDVLDVDLDIDPARFRPPADAEVLPHGEILRRLGHHNASWAPTPEDEQWMLGTGDFLQQLTPAVWLEQVPGAPVLGVDERIDIGLAFQRMLTASDPGHDVPSVHLGSGLGEPLRAALRRAEARGLGRQLEVRIDHMGLVSVDRAVVWFTLVAGGSFVPSPHQPGEAVLTPDGWKVSRPTFASVLALAGIRCPPPP